MADIFDEIKQDLKEEKAEKIVTEHGSKIVIFAILVLIASGSFFFYRDYKEGKSIEVSKVFYQAMETGDLELYDQAIEMGHKGYSQIAKMMKAGQLSSDEKYQEAAKVLSEIINDNSYDKAFRQKAELDLLYLKLNSDELDFTESDISRLDEVIYSNTIFSASAKEIKAYYLIKEKRSEDAIAILEEIISDENSAPSFRTRSAILLSKLK